MFLIATRWCCFRPDDPLRKGCLARPPLPPTTIFQRRSDFFSLSLLSFATRSFSPSPESLIFYIDLFKDWKLPNLLFFFTLFVSILIHFRIAPFLRSQSSQLFTSPHHLSCSSPICLKNFHMTANSALFLSGSSHQCDSLAAISTSRRVFSHCLYTQEDSSIQVFLSSSFNLSVIVLLWPSKKCFWSKYLQAFANLFREEVRIPPFVCPPVLSASGVFTVCCICAMRAASRVLRPEETSRDSHRRARARGVVPPLLETPIRFFDWFV